MTDEMKRYLLAERLAIKVRKEMEDMGYRIKKDYLTSYFDEAITNAIKEE